MCCTVPFCFLPEVDEELVEVACTRPLGSCSDTSPVSPSTTATCGAKSASRLILEIYRNVPKQMPPQKAELFSIVRVLIWTSYFDSIHQRFIAGLAANFNELVQPQSGELSFAGMVLLSPKLLNASALQTRIIAATVQSRSRYWQCWWPDSCTHHGIAMKGLTCAVMASRRTPHPDSMRLRFAAGPCCVLLLLAPAGGLSRNDRCCVTSR